MGLSERNPTSAASLQPRGSIGADFYQLRTTLPRVRQTVLGDQPSMSVSWTQWTLEICSISRALSMDRCNVSAECIRWGLKSQRLSRSLIELQGDFVELGPRVAREIGALGKVLTQQPIGILVRATLPRAVWVAEVHLRIGSEREVFMRAISLPRSQVRERRSCLGSLRMRRVRAATTL